MNAPKGILYGVGLGPGDPDLMSVKAARIVAASTTIAYFRKAGLAGHARTIVEGLVAKSVCEIALEYPVTTEMPVAGEGYINAIRDFYAGAAERLAGVLDGGQDVALLCEGDPFFYGSFLHIYDRLRGACRVEVIPGITGMSGCWTRAALPITYGDDVLTVLPGTLPEAVLAEKLRATDAAVIMKVGRNLEKIRASLESAGRLSDAIYVERGTMAGERIVPLASLEHAGAPYFSIILVPGGRGRRIKP